MPTLPNMSLITPTAGGDSGTWDDKINACFALIDAHDHTSGKGAQVPVAGLDIDDDIVMGGNGLTGVGLVAFTAVTALTAGSVTIFVNAADNELYWRTNAGTNVKLTNGTSINTTLVGGIVGDYSTVGAEVAFSDADNVYTFKDQSAPTKKWARLGSGSVRIYEYDSTESIYVELSAPAALGSTYTITFPTALPSTTSDLQISSTGVLSAKSTVHLIPACAANSSQTAGSTPLSCLDGNAWSTTNGLNKLQYPINTLVIGSVISGFTVKIDKNSDATNTISATLMMTNGLSAASAVSGFSATNAANAPGTLTLSITGQSRTVAADEYFFILVTGTDSTLSGTDSYGSATVTHT